MGSVSKATYKICFFGGGQHFLLDEGQYLYHSFAERSITHSVEGQLKDCFVAKQELSKI
jgi:hypothetical protein